MAVVTLTGHNRCRASLLVSGMTSSVAGFTSPETFAVKIGFGAFLRRLIPMLVLLSLLTLLDSGLALANLGVGPLSWPVALVLTVINAVVLYQVTKRQFDQTWGTARLELSPAGATVVDRYSRTEMPWNQIREIGKADLINPPLIDLTTLPVLSTAAVAAVRRAGQAALIGVGAIRWHGGSGDVDPAGSHELTAIVLGIYDKNWENGRIGDWIRAYRPDLLSCR
jgi:hypothetical protein